MSPYLDAFNNLPFLLLPDMSRELMFYFALPPTLPVYRFPLAASATAISSSGKSEELITETLISPREPGA